jgi:aromatic ring-opening dioxygenase catalytic subunit (LigB family)
MASIIGGLATSHAPQLLMPALKWSELPTRTKGPFHPKPDIADELTDAAKLAKEARCRAALEKLRTQLYAWSPDAVIVVGDDQHENILDDNMPPFVIYAADEVDATLHFTYLGEKSIDQTSRYRVPGDLARQLLTGLMDQGFDPAWSNKTREEFGLGHAFGRALKFLMPDARFPVVPIMVNTYYPPAPSAKRCLALGDAIRQVVENRLGAARVVVMASGGLSHTVIDEAYDEAFMTALAHNDRSYFAAMRSEDLVEGTSEIRNWIIAAGAMDLSGKMIDYVPCYRQPSGVGCAMGFAVWND